MLASILADDPSLPPDLAALLCDELVPAWWFERGDDFDRAGASRLVLRIVRGPWRDVLSHRLLHRYRRGFGHEFLSRVGSSVPLYAIMCLHACGGRVAAILCEVLTATLANPDRGITVHLSFAGSSAVADELRRAGIDSSIVDESADGNLLVRYPRTNAERMKSLVPVLDAWRVLAEQDPHGPQPPANVEEAIAKHGPVAGAESAADDEAS